MATTKRNSLLQILTNDARFHSHRAFRLFPNETVGLLNCQAGGYLAVSQGSAQLTLSGPDGEERHRISWNGQPLTVPNGTERISATAEEELMLHQVDHDTLDYLVALDGLSKNIDADRGQLLQRLSIVGHCPAFRAIPLEHIQETVVAMEERKVLRDEEITTEGQPGDAFYVIAEGSADVFQTDLEDDEVRKINHLGVGDGFGEAALVTGKNRTATVRMATNGKLLVLQKDDFERLISRPLIKRAPPEQVRKLIEEGYRLIDVRYEEELEFEGSIPDSQLFPLEQLHKRREELDPNTSYIVYCASGQRSAIGTLLLAELGIDAVSLEGGINNWPYDKVEPAF